MTVFPHASANDFARSSTSGDVCSAEINSTSFITGTWAPQEALSAMSRRLRALRRTGLKKCRPTTRDGDFELAAVLSCGGMAEAAMRVKEMEEVLVARMASGRQVAARLLKTACLTGSFSATAYIEMSAE